jgi:hypothetical protein
VKYEMTFSKEWYWGRTTTNPHTLLANTKLHKS